MCRSSTKTDDMGHSSAKSDVNMKETDHIPDDCIRIGNKLYNAKKIEAWHPGGKLHIQGHPCSLTDRLLQRWLSLGCVNPVEVTSGRRRGGEIHAT